MDFDACERVDMDVNVWADALREQLTAIDVMVMVGDDLGNTQPRVRVSPADFIKVCKAVGQRFVFEERGEIDVDALIASDIASEARTDVDEDEYDEQAFADELSRLINAFGQVHADAVARARKQCPTHCEAAFFVWHQGAMVFTGIRSSAYEALTDAIDAFCDNIEEQREAADAVRREQDEKDFDRIATELLDDPSFRSLRGKRKRCLYVKGKYAPRFDGYGPGLRRVDPYSDPMNSDLVSLVERVSGELIARVQE